MAATRITLPVGKVRRESYRSFCSTCGRRANRDGRHGARNQTHYCDSVCFMRARLESNRRKILSGSSVTTQIRLVLSAPPPLGT